MSKEPNSQDRIWPDDLDAADVEAITKELGERNAEISAIIKLAKVSRTIRESMRQITRAGERAHELKVSVELFRKGHRAAFEELER
jgi:hypothetical protein